MIVFGVILFSLGIMTGCERKEESGEKSEKVGESEKNILGKYSNQDDPREYIELKKDGTFLMLSSSGCRADTGQWKITGKNEIRLHGSKIVTIYATIKDKIIESGAIDKTFVKQD